MFLSSFCCSSWSEQAASVVGASGGSWSWQIGDDESDGNLLGTLAPTGALADGSPAKPSADLAGCCTAKKAANGSAADPSLWYGKNSKYGLQVHKK